MVELIAGYSKLNHQRQIIQRARQTALASPPRPTPNPASRVHRIVGGRLTTHQVTELVETYAAGETSRALARDFAISKTKVMELVAEAGIPKRPRGPVPGQNNTATPQAD